MATQNGIFSWVYYQRLFITTRKRVCQYDRYLKINKIIFTHNGFFWWSFYKQGIEIFGLNSCPTRLSIIMDWTRDFWSKTVFLKLQNSHYSIF